MPTTERSSQRREDQGLRSRVATRVRAEGSRISSDSTAKGANGIQAVGRALDLLNLLVDGEWGVTEIGRSLRVNKSTASRLLSTMLARGFVARNPITGSFRLGPRIAHLYQAYLDNVRLIREGSALIDRVARDSGETVLLTLFQDGKAVYVDKVDSNHALRTSSRIGDEAPLHCGAAGKSILAFLPVDEGRRLLGTGRLRRYTSHTIGSRAALSRELASIRRQGYAWSDEEINVGVVGLGVPLLDWRGAPLGAISVTAPKMRLDATRRHQLVRILTMAAKDWRQGTHSVA